MKQDNMQYCDGCWFELPKIKGLLRPEYDGEIHKTGKVFCFRCANEKRNRIYSAAKGGKLGEKVLTTRPPTKPQQGTVQRKQDSPPE